MMSLVDDGVLSNFQKKICSKWFMSARILILIAKTIFVSELKVARHF